MNKLFVVCFFSVWSIGAVLTIKDSISFTQTQWAIAQEAKCEQLNAIEPGTCKIGQ